MASISASRSPRRKLEPWLGPQRALALQQHFDRVAETGLGSAASKYLGDLQTKGLTVDVGNAADGPMPRPT